MQTTHHVREFETHLPRDISSGDLKRSPPAAGHWALWRTWVVANALGELAGLAVPALTALTFARYFARDADVSARALGACALIMAGFLEGSIVGFAQWLVLRRVFPKMTAAQWVRWTALGATTAWFLGMLPSVVIHAHGDAGLNGGPQISDELRYALAGAMGGVLGLVLAIPQWLALRRHLRRAGWWIPANAVAWAFAMPLIFVVAGQAGPRASLAGLVIAAMSVFVCAGALAGAIHGGVLVWLAAKER